MSKDFRLQALERLAHSRSANAETALKAEMDAAASTLAHPGNAASLTQAWDVLEIIGFRFPSRVVSIASDFLVRIGKEEVVQPAEGEEGMFGAWYLDHLAGKALDAALRLRYLETRAVLLLLLREAASEREGVRLKVKSGLDSVVAYEAFVFFGDRENARPGIGPQPQAEVLDVLEELADPRVMALFDQARTLAEKILSPTVNSTKWRSDSVQFGFAAVPAIPEVKSVRARAIAFLGRLYALAKTAEKKISVIGGMTAATRFEDRVPKSARVDEMICSNAMTVLGFFENWAVIEKALPVLQALESRAYQIYRHFGDADVVAKAERVKAAIQKNSDYPIYRTLIGFEGVFGPWSKQGERAGFRQVEELRKAKASEYAREIGPSNVEEWKARILEFAKTDSADMATFPIFYQFLREVAARVPALALDLISSDARQIDKFLIPLMAGLWNGSRRCELHTLIERWMADPQLEERYLFASVKMFLSTDTLDIGLLEKLRDRSEASRDVASLRQVASVAVSRFEEEPTPLKALFLSSLESLSRSGDATWVYDAWYRPELRQLIGSMDEESTDRVLANLLLLPKLDFHAEEVLSIISELSPVRVLRFLVARLRRAPPALDLGSSEKYEAIPYEFHKLAESLASMPQEAVRLALELYEDDPDEFRFGGAGLLQRIFPDFPPPFESELLRLVQERRPENFDFVLDVLRNYEGDFRLHGLLRAIVSEAGGDRDIEDDVASVIRSTGVVTGEFGFAEALDRRREAISDWLEDPNENVRRFAKELVKTLERARDVERARAEESVLLRKHRYGEE